MFRFIRLLIIIICLWGVSGALEPTDVEASEELRFLHNDHLGSVVAVSDERGEKVWEERYLPFGSNVSNSVTSVNQTNTVIRQYTGQERDDETNLYNYNARLYNPRVGQFVAADKAETSLAVTNRFAYVRHNPVRLTDPTGNFCQGNTFWWADPLCWVQKAQIPYVADVLNLIEEEAGAAGEEIGQCLRGDCDVHDLIRAGLHVNNAVLMGYGLAYNIGMAAEGGRQGFKAVNDRYAARYHPNMIAFVPPSGSAEKFLKAFEKIIRVPGDEELAKSLAERMAGEQIGLRIVSNKIVYHQGLSGHAFAYYEIENRQITLGGTATLAELAHEIGHPLHLQALGLGSPQCASNFCNLFPAEVEYEAQVRGIELMQYGQAPWWMIKASQLFQVRFDGLYIQDLYIQEQSVWRR